MLVVWLFVVRRDQVGLYCEPVLLGLFRARAGAPGHRVCSGLGGVMVGWAARVDGQSGFTWAIGLRKGDGR